MFFLWLVIAVAAFDGAHMDQYVPLSLPHFCICEKSNIMKIIPRRMCIYNSSNGAHMSDCLSELDKVFNKCHRNKVSCYHIKFNLELKRNESGSSTLQFVRDKKNPARTLILRKSSTNSLDDGYLKKFTIMAKVFSTLFEDRQESFDLMSLISELKKEKNVSEKPNFYFLILKTNSNKFLTISEARNLTSKSTKNGVLMSTAMTDVGFTFNGSQMSFFDEDFWSLVKHQFELNDDLKVIAAKEGLGLDFFEYEDKNDRQKDQVPLGEDFEGMTGQRGHLNGKNNFPHVERNRSKRRTAGGRKKHSRKNKPDFIFLISMGAELPTNMSDLEVKNMTDVGEKPKQRQGLKDPPLGKAEKVQVIINGSHLVANEIHDDVITSTRNAVQDEPPQFRRKLLPYERTNVDSGKGFRFIENGTEIKFRQKRHGYPQNSWCCVPKKNLNAHLRCTIWSHKKVCILTCRDGYSLYGKKKVKTCCLRNSDKDKKWSPEFKACEKDSSERKSKQGDDEREVLRSAGNKKIDEFYDDDEEESPEKAEPDSRNRDHPLEEGESDYLYDGYEYEDDGGKKTSR